MNFDESTVNKIKRLERQIERLKVGEKAKAQDDGWIPVSSTWTYASATTITVPSGAASIYSVGDKFRLTANSVVLQGYIVTVADTLLTVVGDALTNHTFSAVSYSKAATPLGFPLGGKVFIPLTTPLTSTSWDGDTKTNTDNAMIDLSAVFGTPAGIKAVLISVQTIGNTANSSVRFGASSTYPNSLICRTHVANGAANNNGVVPCDANGDVWFQASAGHTFATTIWIIGYWL